MKYFNTIRNLVVAAFVGITGIATAQTSHPLAFGFSGGTARGNWYKDYVGIRFLVTTPASIAGDKAFSTPNDGIATGAGVWGGPAVSMYNKAVKFATPDTDACSATAYSTTLFSGKVALIWRGNCEFGAKALKAQNGGAIAVIIVNNIDGGPVGMGAGAVGHSVTIPVYMISLVDGRDIANQLNAGNNVNVTIIPNWSSGNGSDLGFVPAGYSISANNAMPYNQLNTHNPAYKNKEGAFIANYGLNNQTHVKLVSALTFTPATGAASVVHSDSVSLSSFPVSDSIYAMYTPSYDVPGTGKGKYDLKYTISSDSVDGFTGDNTYTYSFYATDSLYSKGRYDFTNNKPISTTYTGPSSYATDPYLWSVPYYVTNSGTSIASTQFSVVYSNGTAGPGLLGTGDQFYLYVFKWVDTGTMDHKMQNGELLLVGTGVQVFGPTDSSFRTFTVPIGDTNNNAAAITLAPNSWYVISAECPPKYLLGCDGLMSGYPRAYGRGHFDNYFDETYNPIWGGNRATSATIAGVLTSQYANPTGTLYPWAFDGMGTGNIDSVNFAPQKGLIPALPMLVSNHIVNSVNNVKSLFSKLEVYPNPATDILNVSMNLENTAKQVTYSIIDGTGKFVNRDIHHNIQNEVYTFNTSNLAPGNYYMIVTADGRTASRKFVVIK